MAQKGSEKLAAPSAPAKPTALRPPEPVKSSFSDPSKKVPPQRVPVSKTEDLPPPREVQMASDNLPDPEEAADSAPRVSQPRLTVKAKQRRIDPAHESLIGPHFDLQSFLSQDSRKPGRSESIWGQILAYAGVGLITIGTTLVLWSYFGNSQQYAPTGWLVCTVGQMLLFLGVTTLISGGMQQTSHEVTRRVEYIGGRMHRFEQSAEQLLRGPHFDELRERAKGKVKARQTVDELEDDV